jgi:hypothetical protein
MLRDDNNLFQTFQQLGHILLSKIKSCEICMCDTVVEICTLILYFLKLIYNIFVRTPLTKHVYIVIFALACVAALRERRACTKPHALPFPPT